MDWAKFTMDFNSSLEAIMADRTASSRERVLAWTKRHAWGNSSAYTVDRIGGKPLKQKDCASQLGLGRPEVSRAVAALVRGGLVHSEQNNLYPVRNPQASMFKKCGRDSGRWKRFFEGLLSSDPETALQYCALEKQYNQVKKIVMRRYRVWGKEHQVADSTNCVPDMVLAESATEVEDSSNYATQSVVDSNNVPLQECETDRKTEATESTTLTENEGAPSLTINREYLPSSSFVRKTTTTTMLAPEEDPDSQDIAALRTYLSQNGVINDWEIVADLLRLCRIHSPSCSVEQIISEIGGKLGMARQADKPMAWLRKAVPKCFIGASINPIMLAGCPIPQCIELRVNAMNRAGQCVNCGLTREIAQKEAAAANDPALRALIAMRGGRT
jgi:hypothetical protein